MNPKHQVTRASCAISDSVTHPRRKMALALLTLQAGPQKLGLGSRTGNG